MGLPASGKSTLAEHLEKRGAARINRDAIRKRLYGDESVMGDTTVVNKEYYKDLRAAFGKGGPVISDNVNITLFHRKGSIAAARDHGYDDIVIVWVDVPLEVAIERNRNRDRKVDEQVIRDMHADLMKYPDGPRADEGALLVLQNGKDKEHYKVHRVRAAAPAPAPTPDAPKTPTPSAPSAPSTGAVPSGAFALASDLRKQVTLFDACIAAGRTEWAGLTLSVIRQLSESGASLFTVAPSTGTTPGAPAKRPPAAKKPVNATPEEINEQLLKMLAGRPPVASDGDLVALCFNGHLLTKEKAEKLILPLTELFKRAHVIFVQETNVDALRVIAKAMRYGLNASHRNAREQACGILYHPRLHWLGKAPFYHDYLLDVPGHPEYKATLRPALQRRVRDLATGVVYDFVNFHGKSNLGGPDQTRPTRLWQFQAMADEFERQRTKSPYEAREAVRALPTGTETAAESKGLVDNSGWDLPVGAIILGGDYNAPIENPATTETEPMYKVGFQRVSTPDLRWSYQYRGSGGQFDGFFVRGLDGLVSECFIPEMPMFRTRESVLYGEISDHMPVFMTVKAPAKAATAEAPEAAATQPTAAPAETPADSGAPKTDAA
jgi:predicted kinase